MKKYLITGFSGFVSRFFIEFLESNKINSCILGIDIQNPNLNIEKLKYVNVKFKKVDLLEKDKVKNIIHQFKPDFILHLASFSSVAFSWKEPILSFQNNTNIFLNLLEIVRELNINARILSIGSSEEYGNVSEKHIPLKEDHILKPSSPYAVARISQEMLSKVYVDGYGLDVIMTRSFNHIGPYQKDIFVIPSIIKQLVRFKKHKVKKPILITGDISIIRDFIDVRDVVSAYYQLFKKGEKGELYNICSGTGVSLENIIIKIEKMINMNVSVKVDKKLIRPNENRIIVGCNEKIKRDIDWDVTISLEKSLEDIIEYWDNK